MPRRTPQGVRGLKFHRHMVTLGNEMSHPARGAWIEMPTVSNLAAASASRTPQGVRGLKFTEGEHVVKAEKSHPARGA